MSSLYLAHITKQKATKAHKGTIYIFLGNKLSETLIKDLLWSQTYRKNGLNLSLSLSLSLSLCLSLSLSLSLSSKSEA